MKNIILLVLFTVLENNVAFSQDYMFNLMDQTWMVPDLKLMKFDIGDTIQTGRTIFIRKEKLDKFIPNGWKLPSLTDIQTFIANLDGQSDRSGGKLVTSGYLSRIIPFRLSGVYFNSINELVGNNSMTAYYTDKDIDWMFNSGNETAQLVMNISSNRNGDLNIEPGYSKIANGTIYCNLLLIRNK